MTNAKLTRRALLSSVLALVLCFTMLLGTTFAWFTDEAVSSGNKIIAGNLDVQLLLGDGEGKYDKEITKESDPIFGGENSLVAQNNNADTLWEPGKTQVAYLAIANAGNLDLKYQVVLEAKNEVNNLCDVMQYAITPDAKTLAEVGAWTSAQANSVSVGTQIVSVNEAGGTDLTLKKGETHYFALSIHMDETANNDYQGGKVEFDIKVFATQLDSEFDSFGPDYDADLPLTTIVKKTVENTATTTATVTVGGVEKTATVIAVNNTVEIHNGSNADDTIANADDATVAVTLPAGVALEDGATELQLVTKEAEAQTGNTVLAAGNVTVAYEIKVEGVVEATGDLIEVTLKGVLPKNLTNVEVYHKGEPMSASTDESFVYDFNTGDVTLYIKGFSNFTFSGEEVDMTTIPEGAILVSTADELKKALDDAKSGDTIAVVENIADAAITVDKSLTITGEKTLNNVSITASGTDVELTVSGLNFTGSSYINANDAAALTVTNVTADVDPAKCGGNSRTAFIVLGTGEPTHGLKLTVTNNTIKSAQGSADPYSTAIFGWRYIADGSEISNNVFGAENDRYNFVAVKTMNAMDGAVITIENNTVYGTNKNWSYKAFDLYQNCSRENTYTVMSGKNVIHTEVVDTSTYTAVAFYLEDNNDTGSNVILLDNGTTVNGNALTLSDIKNDIAGYDKHYGVNVTVDENGKLTGGTFAYLDPKDDANLIADGYTATENTDGSYTVVAE